MVWINVGARLPKFVFTVVAPFCYYCLLMRGLFLYVGSLFVLMGDFLGLSPHMKIFHSARKLSCSPSPSNGEKGPPKERKKYMVKNAPTPKKTLPPPHGIKDPLPY